jgi:DNA-binding IclR family transcriptional regulator|nr:MAG TPA: Z DNA-binding protein [Caudoviricetes sp.]
MNAVLDLASAVRFAYQTHKPLTEHARFVLIALAFLETIEEEEAVTYDKLVKTTGLSLATIYRAVNSLRDHGIVTNKRRSILTINPNVL